MSPERVTEAQLHAWLDGELPESRRAEVEGYLAAHPLEAERLAAYRRQDESLRARFDPVLDEPVAAAWMERAALRPRRLLRFAAVAGWLALGGLAGWHLHGINVAEHRADAPPPWARRAAMAHAVYSPEIRHPVEVAADQRVHLVAWLSKRLGTPLTIPPLEGLGYELVGGRLLPGEQGPVAQFMYQDARGQRLTLYVRMNRDQNRQSAFRFAQDGNVRVFYWIDRELGYALSGEIARDELLRVATAVYKHLNP